MFPCYVEQLLHGRILSEQMHGNDRSGLLRNGCFHLFRIDQKRLGVHVHQNGLQLKKRDHLCSCHIGEACRDHLVSWLQVEGHHGHLQRIRPIGTGNHMGYIQIGFQFTLEGFHFRSIDELGRSDHLTHSTIHFFFDVLVLRLEIDHVQVAHNSLYLSTKIKRTARRNDFQISLPHATFP
ncbi:MAG: Uncharacterised protein [Flavobacteriia bacterium]|nr:MAG: Uncharacterised protein [Flavobacteriia bacterium]